MYKVLFIMLSLFIGTANAAHFPCLVDQGDSDGSGENNINELNYVKYVLAHAYETAADLTCDGFVNINDVNKEKSSTFLGSTEVWQTVGGNGYSRIDCAVEGGYTCDTFAHFTDWINGNCGGHGSCSIATIGGSADCVPITWPPHGRIYSDDIGSSPPEPSMITDDLELHFWGHTTSGAYTAYYTMCYLASHSP